MCACSFHSVVLDDDAGVEGRADTECDRILILVVRFSWFNYINWNGSWSDVAVQPSWQRRTQSTLLRFDVILNREMKKKTKLYIWSSDQMSIDEIQINSSLEIHPKLVFDDHERRFRQLHQGSSKLVCWLIKTCGDFFCQVEKMKMKCFGVSARDNQALLSGGPGIAQKRHQNQTGDP